MVCLIDTWWGSAVKSGGRCDDGGQGGGHGPDGKGNLWNWVVVSLNDKIISLRISFIDIQDLNT